MSDDAEGREEPHAVEDDGARLLHDTRAWKTSLLGSVCVDPSVTLHAYCLYCCAWGDLNRDLGGSWCFGCVCPGGPCSRYQIRTAYGIQGSLLEDCIYACLCPVCNLTQCRLEVNHRGAPPSQEMTV